jgi:hypothetical protein
MKAALAACAAVLLAVRYFVGPANAQEIAPKRTDAVREASIKRFLRHLDDSRSARFVVAFADHLRDNSSTDPIAIVYLVGENWCGSGGCHTLILAPQGTSWRVVTKISITQPPIMMLRSKSHGWHDVGVWVQGGGIQPGYEAELRFDGKTYPSDPSTPPAIRLKRPRGEVVISSTENAVPLYDAPHSTR